MRNGTWDTIEHITKNFTMPINRNNKDTWKTAFDIISTQNLTIRNSSICHAQYVWDIRQNKKITNIFAKIHDIADEDLLCTFEETSILMPHEPFELKWNNNVNFKNLHTFRSFTSYNFPIIRSFVTAYDINNGDSTLCFLESSNKYHEEFCKTFMIGYHPNAVFLQNDDHLKFFEDRNCLKKSIRCPAGSIVLWDMRTMQFDRNPSNYRKHENLRSVSYICMLPRSLSTPAQRQLKIKAFKRMTITNYMSIYSERSVGKKVPRPKLTFLGKRLAGFDC